MDALAHGGVKDCARPAMIITSKHFIGGKEEDILFKGT